MSLDAGFEVGWSRSDTAGAILDRRIRPSTDPLGVNEILWLLWPLHEHDVIAGAPAMVQKHDMTGRLVAPR